MVPPRIIIVLWLLMGNGILLYAQPINVRGKIISSDDGEPILGTTIYSKGTEQTVVADIEGYYTLETSLGDTLTFHFIGMLGQEHVVCSNELNVMLEPAAFDDSELFIHWTYYYYALFSVETIYAKQWGYGFSYHSKHIHVPANKSFPLSLLRYVSSGVRLANINPDDSQWKITAVLQLSLNRLFGKYNRYVPFFIDATTGYYFDTNFKSIESGNFAYGVEGVTRSWKNFSLALGYNGFVRQNKNNYWFLKLYYRIPTRSLITVH